MPNMLIRSVPDEDLQAVHAAAERDGQSLQGYMLKIVHELAVAEHNREILDRVARRVKAKKTTISIDAVLAAKDAAQGRDE